MSFANATTAALLSVRSNLLRGLDIVAGHIDAGTFDVVAPGKASPPCQSGHLTLALLAGVDAELAIRNGDV